MRKTYFLILAVAICVILAGYIMNIPQIIHFTDTLVRLMRNVWIAVPALIFAFVATGKRYWLSLVICGLIDAVLVQWLVWHNSSIGIESTFMMTLAFLAIAYLINLVRVIFK